jgi:integrase
MSGHIRNKGKRQDGSTKWEARWRNPLNPAERRERMFRAKQDAQRWLLELDAASHQGTLIDPYKAQTPSQTIAAEWANTWLDLEPKTIAGYDHILRKHVLPAFGPAPVQSITPDVIQAWVGELSQGPPRRNPTTVRNIYAVLRGLLKFAVQRRYIATNPCEAVRLPKRNLPRQARHLYLTPHEVNELATALPVPYDTAVYVAAYCGLRAGELWALRRQDIDLLNGTITVARAFKEVYSSNPDLDSGLLVGAPKSRASNRVVSIPAPVKALLVAYLGQTLPGGEHREALVFASPDGSAIRHGSFYSDVFRRAVAATWPAPHRLHGLRFHDLRHTCASLSLAISPNLHVVKERLGHESITTTIDTYGHLLPSTDVALMEGLSALFEQGATPPVSDSGRVTPLRPPDGSGPSS